MIITPTGKKVQAHSYGLNKMRTADYINIKHKIASCTKPRHVESMRQLVERFAKQNLHGNELISMLNQKEEQLQQIHEL